MICSCRLCHCVFTPGDARFELSNGASLCRACFERIEQIASTLPSVNFEFRRLARILGVETAKKHDFQTAFLETREAALALLGEDGGECDGCVQARATDSTCLCRPLRAVLAKHAALVK